MNRQATIADLKDGDEFHVVGSTMQYKVEGREITRQGRFAARLKDTRQSMPIVIINTPPQEINELKWV